MLDLPDLFPGFACRRSGDIFLRTAGGGPAVVLLHGFPQTHAEWHRIAPALAEHFTVVVMDSRGYGASLAPQSKGGALYAKRVMAQDVVAVMRTLGHERFAVVGHDRGGRVAYRLALDHPDRVAKLAVLDIVPTGAMWRGMDAARAMQVYHWLFLAQPAPLPETLIGASWRSYLDQTLASWTKEKTLEAFDPRALEHYRAFFSEPARIHACCEDYRAGATIDRDLDDADLAAGRKIEAPTLVLWGGSGIPAKGASPLEVWRDWAKDVHGHAIDCGHFLPEEAPAPTLKALMEFLA
jgi:haloacetate dehalogenase